VAPGVIKTPMHTPEMHAFLAGLHPLGRMGEIGEVVDAVLYLVVPDKSLTSRKFPTGRLTIGR
jgi:NAD(P)-dependent dehydrogenase (short-subunit alcohol dehydrogenase family)